MESIAKTPTVNNEPRIIPATIGRGIFIFEAPFFVALAAVVGPTSGRARFKDSSLLAAVFCALDALQPKVLVFLMS